ncbi:MAG: replication-associated recombination protein A [Negativicutes bacterium]
MDLFSNNAYPESSQRETPLAVRMRPEKITQFIGQENIVGSGTFLRQMLDTDNIPSIILFGPPGTGKTTLANVIAHTTGAYFEQLNAVSAGVADIRKVVEASKGRLLTRRQRTILFIDEIHRFNKAQQDALLPHVENGTVILIGATTENPYFEVNSPLLSRMRVVELKPLCQEEIVKILEAALTDAVRGLGDMQLEYDNETLELIAEVSGGDARIALTILEQAAQMLKNVSPALLTKDMIRLVAAEKIQVYDRRGDNHYDVVSAFIKSMRGSDPDAALHYLARMLEAGEDIKFIARRVVICAAEDVGNADPQALVLAMAAAQAVQFIGMPEARIPLAQAVTYIAGAEKSNAAYLAIDQAMEDVRKLNCGPVPQHLRDRHYRGAAKLGRGQGYVYPHDYPDAIVKQQYLPDKLIDKTYYRPKSTGKEKEIYERLQRVRKNEDKVE